MNRPSLFLFVVLWVCLVSACVLWFLNAFSLLLFESLDSFFGCSCGWPISWDVPILAFI